MAKGYKTLPIEDFSGGWNPRDAASQIADNESPECLNVTLDERGGIAKRLGFTRSTNRPDAVNIQTLFYSKALDCLLAQSGPKLFKSTDGGDTWSAAIKTFSTSETCDMVDHLGKVVVVHPADTCFTYDGTTFSAAIANSPKANAVTVWQNYIWTIGDATNASTLQRVSRSDAGAATWPATPVYTDLRYKDDEPLTAIGGGIGMDESGRGGLLVYKHQSHYRIHDSGTLANTIVDYNYGAGGPRATVTSRGVTYAISQAGIIATRGDQGRAEKVSGKVDPVFRPEQMRIDAVSLMVAGRLNDRIYFSLPWVASWNNMNNLTLEMDPDDGWIVPHNYGWTCFATYGTQTEKLYGGFPGTATPVDNRGYMGKLFQQATDDGGNIAARWQSRWFSPYGHSDVRFRRLVVNGRGSFTLRVKLNYDTGNGDERPVAINGAGTYWGQDTWGTDTTGTGLLQSTQELHSLGKGRAISFEAYDASNATITQPALLDTGAQQVIGAFALYGLTLDMVPLGAS